MTLSNVAAEEGPRKFPWWRDWRGECCAIVASGPSLKKEDVEKLRDRLYVLAVKGNVDLCPWADVVYGCDYHWWRHRLGLPEFKGLKLAYDAGAQFKGLQHVEIDRNFDGLLTARPGLIGSGGNSGFQALNIAVQFGATGILLLGFDMRSNGNSPHWYGRNTWPGAANPIDSNYERWRTAYKVAAPRATELGIDVVNCSPISTLKCFRFSSIEETLERWGL